MEDIFVILGIDYHIFRISKTCKSAVEKHQQNVPEFAVANYGVVYPTVRDAHMKWHEWQKAVKLGCELIPFCSDFGYQYYQIPCDTIPVHLACEEAVPIIGRVDEVLALIHISKYFYDKGYANVYLMQNDISFKKNTIDRFNFFRKGVTNWSFIAPLHYEYSDGPDETPVDYKRVAEIGARKCESWCRFGIDFCIFNKEFISKLYATYNNEMNMYKEIFSHFFSPDGDLGLADLAKEKLFGYEAIIVSEHTCGVKFSNPWQNEMGFLKR